MPIAQLERGNSNLLLECKIRKEIAKYTEKTLRPGRQTGTQNGLPKSFVVTNKTIRYRANLLRKKKRSRP
jgi:hypothetical protein